MKPERATQPDRWRITLSTSYATALS